MRRARRSRASVVAMEPDPTYNTIMAISVGLGLVMLALLGYRLGGAGSIHRRAWAVTFTVLGGLLVLTGAHMTLTWPLSGPTAFDNIAFGEPSLAMGAILLAIAFLIARDRSWRPSPTRKATGASIQPPPEPIPPPPDELSAADWPRLATLLQPLSWFGAIMGLALIAIAFVGPFFSPWEAPPQEPISGEFADYPWLENAFIALLYAGVGIGALLAPFALARRSIEAARGLLRTIAVLWAITGTVWILFGAMNYYTHIGLTINTYEEQQAAMEAQGQAPPEDPSPNEGYEQTAP